MKKTILLNALMLLGISSYAQGWYESFNYTVGQTVGGTCTAAPTTCNENNWITIDSSAQNSPAGNTFNVVAGSLSYTGMPTSTGNKITLVQNTGTNASRDIGRVSTITGNIAYASFLLNIPAATGLNAAISDNNTFFHFGIGDINNGKAGAVVCRLSIRKNTADGTFSLGIENNNTGTAPTYTAYGTNLTYGQTYLIVVKYDNTNGATTPHTASFWVNPDASTFGGTEPTPSATNNSGTSIASSNVTSAIIRSSGQTPVADFDELRLGTTWADVTTNILPITLKAFSGKRNTLGNILTWSTVSETNNKGFEIQSSNNGLDFSAIEFIKSKAVNGNSNQQIDYSFIHSTVSAKQYYRLKQIDVDGKFSYSPIVLINTEKPDKNVTLLSENPVKNEIKLSVNTFSNSVVTVQLYDVNGKMVKQQNKAILSGSNTISIPVTELTNGIYFIKIQTNNWQEVIKIVK